MGSKVQVGKGKGGAVLEGLPITPEGVPRYGREPVSPCSLIKNARPIAIQPIFKYGGEKNPGKIPWMITGIILRWGESCRQTRNYP
jgi:hypothetical protein